MMQTALLFIESFEKLNSVVDSSVLSQAEIAEGKKIINDLNKNIEELGDYVMNEGNIAGQEQLKKIEDCLDTIAHKMSEIYKLGIVAAKTHAANMDAAGYNDE